MKRKNNNKRQNFILIVIEYLWLGMAIFTFSAAMIKFNDGNEHTAMFAWVYLVLSILCLVMFFVKRYTRRQRRRKH